MRRPSVEPTYHCDESENYQTSCHQNCSYSVLDNADYEPDDLHKNSQGKWKKFELIRSQLMKKPSGDLGLQSGVGSGNQSRGSYGKRSGGSGRRRAGRMVIKCSDQVMVMGGCQMVDWVSKQMANDVEHS